MTTFNLGLTDENLKSILEQAGGDVGLIGVRWLLKRYLGEDAKLHEDWMNTPIAQFNDLTPTEIILSDVQEVVRYLEDIVV